MLVIFVLERIYGFKEVYYEVIKYSYLLLFLWVFRLMLDVDELSKL